MTYEETINFLFSSLPLYHKTGSAAYKPGLQNIEALDNLCGNPHNRYLTIHVAGSNGKGSVSHTLASVLQSSGLKTGLYTSPHLKDFRERIRVDGEMIPEERVVAFTERLMDKVKELSPSFFEWTTEMAFDYFAEAGVDIAVIETGLGGRLDSTNIITPILSVITNISLEHTALLGDTVEKIAFEKAGIIKPCVPVVIGESDGSVREVFANRAKEVNAPIAFADSENPVLSSEHLDNGRWRLNTVLFGNIEYELGGSYQLKNAVTILKAIEVLKNIGIAIDRHSVADGFLNVTSRTGLRGRWETVCNNPKTVCDTGHNVGGIKYVAEQLKNEHYNTLHIVFGMVNDKDTDGVLSLLPSDARYYFTQPSIPRALPSGRIMEMGLAHGLSGNSYASVKEAYEAARNAFMPGDMIYVGGSTFVVADLLEAFF